MSEPIKRVLDHLDGVKKSGDGWKAPCPAHDDRNPSLSINEATGGTVLLKCHAGCSFEEVTGALGLEPKDLYPTNGSTGGIVATYPYTDEDGDLLFQGVRKEGKQFRQRQPDGSGGWKWHLRGVRRVLYRLPAVLEAAREGRVVFVVEGEKDVYTLERWGLTATTNPMGAGSWQEEYSEALKGARVVILPDNDEEGNGHAGEVARSVFPYARSVRIVELPGLPEKGDVTDWKERGGSAEELQQLVKEAPVLDAPPEAEELPEVESEAGKDQPQATPLFGFKKPDPLGWIVAGLIPERHVSVLAADGGTGKSFFAVFLSLCIALGRSFFGLGTQRGRVLYVDYELDSEEQRRRVWRVAEGMGVGVDDERLTGRLFYFRPTAPLGTEEAHDEVMLLIEKHEIDFVVLDSLTVASAGADVTASEDVVPMMQRMREWGTVLAIDHISGNAARGNQSKATPFGSVFKRNIARSTFTLAKADGGGYMLMPDKSNFTAKQDSLYYAVEFDGESGPVTFEKVDSTDGRMAGAYSNMSSYDVTLTAIKKLTDDDRPVTPEDVVKWRDEHDVDPIKKGTVRNHFTTLAKDGKIELDGSGGALPITHGFHAPSSIHGAPESGSTTVNGKNAPESEDKPINAPSESHSHHSRPLSEREGVNEANGTAENNGYPRFENNQRVETPKGSGRVVKVEGSKVYVELDSAPIGETEAFKGKDLF